MLLVTIFVELCVVAGRSQMRADSPHAISQRLCCGLEKNGMVRAGHGRGMVSVNQKAALCKSNGKDTSQTLSGMVWQGKGMGAACYV